MILVSKLISGEEIIAETEMIEHEGVKVFVFKNPAQIIAFPTPEGKITHRLIPFMPYAEDDVVPMSADMVMTQLKVDASLHNQYNSVYGSGIQIPDNKIQIAQ